MSLTQKIAMAAGALTLGAAGVAAASTAPDAADTGLTKASEHVGTELTDDSASDDATSEGTGPVDNHGADVSAAAQSDEFSGREHGEAVSEVARADHGAEATDEAQATEASDDDAAEDEATDDDAAEQSTLGADNAGEHGRP